MLPDCLWHRCRPRTTWATAEVYDNERSTLGGRDASWWRGAFGGRVDTASATVRPPSLGRRHFGSDARHFSIHPRWVNLRGRRSALRLVCSTSPGAPYARLTHPAALGIKSFTRSGCGMSGTPRWKVGARVCCTLWKVRIRNPGVILSPIPVKAWSITWRFL